MSPETEDVRVSETADQTDESKNTDSSVEPLPPPSDSRIDPYTDLVDLFRLALPLTGATGQFSSYDRTGGEQDYSWWTYLRAEPRRAVLADVCGPGCISRIWVTAFDPVKARIDIYIDGSMTPIVSAFMRDFFGNLPPFTPPLAGPTSGAWVSYVPIPFQRSCRIEAFDAPQFNGQFYYDVSYRTFQLGQILAETFNMPPTATQQARLDQFSQQWIKRGEDPKPTQAGEVTVSGVADKVPANQTVKLVTLQGAGTITKLMLNVSPNSAGVLANARLRWRWDGSANYAIDSPLGSFFASGFGPADAQGLPLGTKGELMYCYLAMPYSNGAEIELWSGEATAIDLLKFTIAYVPSTAPETSPLRLHAESRAERPAQGVRYHILETKGAGHYLGCSLSIHSLDNNWIVLEGDEQIYVDGEKIPSIKGTGTEDYFNGGFYFANGPYSQPYSGCSVVDSKQHRVSAYRLCITDPVVFANQTIVTIEHGFGNKSVADYESTAYFYLNDSSVAMPVLPDYAPLPEGELINGDMEDGFGGYNAGEANGWLAYQSGTYFGYPPCEFAADKVLVQTGSYSQKISLALPASGFQSAGIAQQVAVTRGIRYRVTANLRLDLTGDLKPGDAIARLGIGLAGNTNFEDPKVAWTDAPLVMALWHKVTAEATAEADFLTIFAGGMRKSPSIGGTATVRVDAVTLTRTDSVRDELPVPSIPPIILNPSFESGIAPWQMWVGAGGNSDPLERDFGSAADGSWTLAVKGIGSGGKGAYQYVPDNWVAGKRYQLRAAVHNLANSGLMYSIGYAFGDTGPYGSAIATWGRAIFADMGAQNVTVDLTYQGTRGVTIYLRVTNGGDSERAGFDAVTIVELEDLASASQDETSKTG